MEDQEEKFFCQYCKRECANSSGLIHHEVSCNKNPKRVKITYNFQKQVCPLCHMNIVSGKPFEKHIKLCETLPDNKRIQNYRATWSQEEKNAYIAAGHYCKRCGGLLTTWFGSGTYCSIECRNSREHTDETKQKISEGVNQYNAAHGITPVKLRPVYRCKDCNSIICGGNKTGYCKDCYRNHYTEWVTDEMRNSAIEAGKKSAKSQSRRSKNEVAFCELCEQFFREVKHNEPIFNGWDADIIIEDLNIAILWNGIWHYKQIGTHQSLSQVQTRDKIKIDQIVKCGYIPYIIEDLGKYNTIKVNREFEKLLNYIQLTFVY